LHIKKEKNRAVELKDKVQECRDISSLLFRDEETRGAKPGQYLMVWLPGVDEVPMSVSAIDMDGLSRITVREVGETTFKLNGLGPGDRIGLRGPFGNGYKVQGDKPLLVAGGSGAASLMPLVEEMLRRGITPTFVLGARSADMLLFVDRLEDALGERLIVTTDDGSRGYSGYASGYAALLMEEERFDAAYTCGPELMMAKVYQSAQEHGIPVQASLERYVKCAVGLCGNCAIGPYRVCKDGPVFDTEMLNEVRGEFGVTQMDASGRAIRVEH
jgi:dihydroorotate dehydrogenase electron transfer subunit